MANPKSFSTELVGVLALGATLLSFVISKFVDEREGISHDFLFVASTSVLIAAAASMYYLTSIQKRRGNRLVLISYAHEDHENALQIKRILESDDYKTWMIDEDVLPGQEIMNTFKRICEEAAAAVIVVSKNTMASQNAQLELGIILNPKREGRSNILPIIPVVVEGETNIDELSHIRVARIDNSKDKRQFIQGVRAAVKEANEEINNAENVNISGVRSEK